MKSLTVFGSLVALSVGLGCASIAKADGFQLKPLYCANQDPAGQPIFFILKAGKITEWEIHYRQGRVWLRVPFSMDDTYRVVNDYPSFFKQAKARYWRGNGILTSEWVEFRSGSGSSGYVLDEEYLFTPNMDTAYNLSITNTLSGRPVGRAQAVYLCQDLTPALDTTDP